MASALEVLTLEGAHALNVAASTGARLVVTGAKVGMSSVLQHNGSLVQPTVSGYGSITGADVSSWGDAQMDCVSMLPCSVTIGADGAPTDQKMAIDCEFEWLPEDSADWDAAVVVAQMYYAFDAFDVNKAYSTGDVTSYGTGYYRALADVAAGGAYPPNDSTNWEAVTVSQTTIGKPPMYAVDGEYIALHVSTTVQPISVAPGMGFHYKLRLFLDGAAFDTTDMEHCPVYLDSLVTPGASAEQLSFLAEMAETMRDMRDAILGRG